MSRHDEAKDFIAPHARGLGEDGRPAQRERFLAYLDRPSATVATSTLTLDDGCTRLAAEHPTLWTAVEMCCRQGLTERETAARLGVSPALAHRRKAAGLRQLAAWCNIKDAGDVALVLQHGRPSRAS